MLKKTVLPTTFLGLIAGLALSIVACNGGDGDGAASAGAGCVAGQAAACSCPNGEMGSQTCLPDGTGFQPCSCTGGGTEGGSSSSDDGDADTDGMDMGADSTGPGIVCGDGMAEGDECDEMSESYCPEDCEAATEDGSTGEVMNCDTEPTYQLMVPNVPSLWESGGVMGYAAGNAMCMAMGADHVCDYEEVVIAEGKGEFAAVAAGTTAWMHRTTTVDIGGGVMSPPGVGGRCVDWTYSTNHISDGEFYTIQAAGAVMYTFDNDTNYNAAAPAPNPHVQMGLLECGGVNRAILCCYPECQPEG